MKNVNYLAVAEAAMKKIKTGAFLTVKAGERLNTMTIGWATIGFCWQKPIFMIMVRNSRHTFSIIEDAADFTVSVPALDMKNAILYCGTQSGRDVDKFQELGMEAKTAQQTTSPIMDVPGLHFECRIVHKSAMDPQFLDESYHSFYPEKDYHTLYFGEILECYEI
jgi:flavin reductase (DIM6/NTAB) family NADH-FMN oxidoreductase RutF